MSARREDRSDEAFDRDAERFERTASEQLTVLDRRLGKGVGAKRERARLLGELTPKKRKQIES